MSVAGYNFKCSIAYSNELNGFESSTERGNQMGTKLICRTQEVIYSRKWFVADSELSQRALARTIGSHKSSTFKTNALCHTRNNTGLIIYHPINGTQPQFNAFLWKWISTKHYGLLYHNLVCDVDIKYLSSCIDKQMYTPFLFLYLTHFILYVDCFYIHAPA